MRVMPIACAAFGLMTVVTVGSASAQVVTPVTFTASFPFLAGHTVLPAGQYRVQALDDDIHVLEIKSAKHGAAGAFVEVEDATASTEMKKTEVVFKRFGDQYVLKNVWVAGEATGALVVPTRAERHQTKSLTAAPDVHLQATRGTERTHARK